LRKWLSFRAVAASGKLWSFFPRFLDKSKKEWGWITKGARPSFYSWKGLKVVSLQILKSFHSRAYIFLSMVTFPYKAIQNILYATWKKQCLIIVIATTSVLAFEETWLRCWILTLLTRLERSLSSILHLTLWNRAPSMIHL